MENIEILGEKKWEGRVVKETLYGVIADYGIVMNTMQLIRDGTDLEIYWMVNDGEDLIDEVEIGISTVGKTVYDYQGVFELPDQAIELLNEYGLNTREVEV